MNETNLGMFVGVHMILISSSWAKRKLPKIMTYYT